MPLKDGKKNAPSPPEKIPTRAESRSNAKLSLDPGLLVIGGLIILTIILIIIAMLRDDPETTAYIPQGSASTYLEVEPWLTPIPVY